MTRRYEEIQNKRRFGFVQWSFLVVLLLIVASWIFIFWIEDADFLGLFSEKNSNHAQEFLGGMVGIGEDNPAFTDPVKWKQAIILSFETLTMSIMAIGFATIAMLFTVVPAARNAADGTLTITRKWYSWLVYSVIRFLYVLSRGIPELIWAMIIIFIFKPGILPGAIALALHNFGILGKLCAEVIEDIDLSPIRSLASSGAGKIQLLIYGVIPTVMPKFLTYILYRWEVIIRTTIIVGFVGAGGLGREFKLSMSFFHYTEITLFLLCYFILVVMVDFISAGLRKAMR